LNIDCSNVLRAASRNLFRGGEARASSASPRACLCACRRPSKR
jgi:hypothetical protein